MALLADQILTEAMERFPLPARPILQWKNLRVTAGIAYYSKVVIGLSALILDTPEKLRDTLLHEYAHLLAVHRHGRKAGNHGVYWQEAMADLGQPPRVRHSYDCERNTKRQTVSYKCQRCGATIQRSRRLPKNRRYVHAPCGGGLRLIAVERA